MTALFLNLHASFWNVYKVDLEGSKKKCKPKVKQYSCEKSYAFLQNLKFWSDFLFSFPFSPTYNKSLFILPPTPIMYELLKLIFSLPFLFQKHTDTKKKGGGGIIIHLSLLGITITVCQIFITTWGISARLSFCEFLKLITFIFLCSLLV